MKKLYFLECPEGDREIRYFRSSQLAGLRSSTRKLAEMREIDESARVTGDRRCHSDICVFEQSRLEATVRERE